MEHDVIEGGLFGDDGAGGVHDRGVEGGAWRQPVLSGSDRRERLEHAVTRDGGQVADAPEVDAEDGDFAAVQLPGAAEQGAVTAEGDQQVDLGGVERRQRDRRHFGQLR